MAEPIEIIENKTEIDVELFSQIVGHVDIIF